MSLPGFDDSRIKDYPDKKLLEYIRAYYKPFINGDSDAQKALQTEDFVITDIRKNFHSFSSLPISPLWLTAFHSALGFVRIPREQWHAINTSFATLLKDVHITAIALYGSSKPGDSSLLEHLTEVTLADDPPPGAAEQLPPGTKKGDRIGMIDLDVSWWNEDGKVTKQLVYGRTTWKTFDFHAFDPPNWWGKKHLLLPNGIFQVVVLWQTWVWTQIRRIRAGRQITGIAAGWKILRLSLNLTEAITYVSKPEVIHSYSSLSSVRVLILHIIKYRDSPGRLDLKNLATIRT